jgi:large subunit ribosomal protein L23
MSLNNLVLKKPIISEKATELAAAGKYIFLVDPRANKQQIKTAIEKIYQVHVTQINVIRMRNRSQSYKKAIVTLKSGETIDVIGH